MSGVDAMSRIDAMLAVAKELDSGPVAAYGMGRKYHALPRPKGCWKGTFSARLTTSRAYAMGLEPCLYCFPAYRVPAVRSVRSAA